MDNSIIVSLVTGVICGFFGGIVGSILALIDIDIIKGKKKNV